VFFFLTAVALVFLSAIPGSLARKGSPFWDKCYLTLSVGGCILGIAATVFILSSPENAIFNTSWSLVPGAALAFKLDGLSAVFLFPAFLVTAAGSMYGSGYWPINKKPATGAWLRFFFPLLAGSMMLLLCSNNAFLFLVNWEIMALSGYFLIITERDNEEAQKAGIIYFAATHTGTLALMGAFAFLLPLVSGVYFPEAASLAGTGWQASTVFLFALFGFGFKAGLIPLHIWLPGAHANAPSHVSALMSGVMIKMGIYGLIRTTSFFNSPPAWWGETIVVIGLVSAIFGVVLAISQHDIKRLLAYHSVENIGIILLGFGIALIGRSHHNDTMVVLGLAGALLHVINHGLFKGLLFLSAGSIIHKTGTRSLMKYGGLWKSMPYTGFFFLGGAVAICGLPPLNGFVSEWLVYLGIFNNIQSNLMSVGIIAAPALAMTGGLALLCFAKVFGLSFLGEPRTTMKIEHDSPKSMLFPMGLLFACCLWIGVAPATLLPLLQRGVESWTGRVVANPLNSLVSAGHISVFALSLFIIAVILATFLRRKTPQPKGNNPTWGCGFTPKVPRVQYTVTSFAQMIVEFFGWSLQTDIKEVKPRGIFPVNGKSSLETHTPDVLLDNMIQPSLAKATNIAVSIRHIVQRGIVSYYLFYMIIAIAALIVLTYFL
jgi:hydrogenase-4 component B